MSGGERRAAPDGSEGEQPAAARRAYELHYLHPSPTDYPHIYGDLDPIDGYIRARIEDFQVEELPLYPASGRGDHLYLTVAKRNRTTIEVREQIARAFGVAGEDVGFAGFKDKRGVTVQRFSVRGGEEEHITGLVSPWVEVRGVERHSNKIRTGHLRGNRFRIVVRGCREGAIATARALLARARDTGIPNFYGSQRFGRMSDGSRVGHALLHRDPKAAVDQLLAPDALNQQEFRLCYARGDYAAALDALPPGRPTEAALLHALRRYPGNHRAAVRRIPGQMRKLYFSAFQSYLFNWALRERLAWRDDALWRPERGDLAQFPGRSVVFDVEDVERECARAEQGEISPSGPIYGRKMRFATHRPGDMEWAILRAEGLRPQSFLSHVKGLRLDGTRRPCRVRVEDGECADLGGGAIRLQFTLPPGCYATALLDQLMGPGRVDLRAPAELAAEAESAPSPSEHSTAAGELADSREEES